jgi:hypothetical protein
MDKINNEWSIMEKFVVDKKNKILNNDDIKSEKYIKSEYKNNEEI